MGPENVPVRVSKYLQKVWEDIKKEIPEGTLISPTDEDLRFFEDAEMTKPTGDKVKVWDTIKVDEVVVLPNGFIRFKVWSTYIHALFESGEKTYEVRKEKGAKKALQEVKKETQIEIIEKNIMSLVQYIQDMKRAEVSKWERQRVLHASNLENLSGILMSFITDIRYFLENKKHPDFNQKNTEVRWEILKSHLQTTLGIPVEKVPKAIKMEEIVQFLSYPQNIASLMK